MPDELGIVWELQRLRDSIQTLDEKLDKVRTEDLPGFRVQVASEIATLKAKAGIWGLAAGVLGSIGTILMALLLQHK